MTDDTQYSEGDRIAHELTTCVNCGSESLATVETNQYALNELWRLVRCETCDAAYREEFTLVETEIEDLPTYTRDDN